MAADQSPTYGGQAVIEGVMIRGQDHVSIAIRRPDGTIARRCEALNPVFTGRLRQLPLIRGVVVLTETLALGMRALTYSANVQAEAEGLEVGRGAVVGMIAVSLVFGIGVFFLLPVLASTPLEGFLGNDLISNIAEGAIRLGLFLGYVYLISLMEGIRRVFMYHGAEHMTVHAQERGDPLTVADVGKHSPAHPRCGTAFLLVVMVIAVLAFVLIPRDPFWWLITSRVILIPVIAAIAYELTKFSGSHSDNPVVRVVSGPSLWLQSLTTRPPEDDQIEVAIDAMKQALEADAAG